MNTFDDRQFFEDCFNTTTIYGMPTLEYYNQIECNFDLLNEYLPDDNYSESNM